MHYALAGRIDGSTPIPPGWKPGSTSARMADATVFKKVQNPPTRSTLSPVWPRFPLRAWRSVSSPPPFAGMHAYPNKLAALVRHRWNAPFSGANLFKLPVCPNAVALPPAAQLRELLSTCYQASLLREEGRAVRFRLMLYAPEPLNQTDSRSGLLEVMPFQRPRQLTPNELRRLATTAAFEHALVAARIEDETGIRSGRGHAAPLGLPDLSCVARGGGGGGLAGRLAAHHQADGACRGILATPRHGRVGRLRRKSKSRGPVGTQ